MMMYNSKFTRFFPNVNRFQSDIHKTLSHKALRRYVLAAIASCTAGRKLANCCRFRALEISAENGISPQEANDF
jgi:hypothetical protein